MHNTGSKKNVRAIKVTIESKRWELALKGDGYQIYRPAYMLKPERWKNLSDAVESKEPYIYIEKNPNEEIIGVRFYPGLVRELPLFYSYIDGILRVSDTSFSSLFSGLGIDERNCQEFLCFGYTTADRTIIKDLYSVQAGRTLIVENKEFWIEHTFQYNTHEEFDLDDESLWQKFNEVSESVFDKLIKNLRGETVILPLSGGYDSRFIAAMLKKGGVENVKCYAWGSRYVKDIKTSEAIAKKLGYPWRQIDYSAENIQRIFSQPEMHKLLLAASENVSISGVASLPFIDYLRRNNISGVLLPGHTGDFISGGHIPLRAGKNTTAEEMHKLLMRKHSLEHNFDVYDQIGQQFNSMASTMTPWKAYEAWELQERQAKFIVNANVFYESIGIFWSVPLWDYNFVKFWSRMPLRWRKGSLFYNNYLENNLFTELGLGFALKLPTVTSRIPSIHSTRRVFKVLKDRLYKKIGKSRGDEFGFNVSLPYLFDMIRSDRVSSKHSGSETRDELNYDPIGTGYKSYSFLARAVLLLLQSDKVHRDMVTKSTTLGN